MIDETAATIQIPCEVPLIPSGAGPTTLLAAPDPGTSMVKTASSTSPSLATPSASSAMETLLLLGTSFEPNPGQAAVTLVDGSTVTPENPAKPGEAVSIWAVGLGLPCSGVVKTGQANPDPPLTTTINVDFDFRSNAGIPQPPVPLERCGPVFQSNLTINVGGLASYDGAAICVAQ